MRDDEATTKPTLETILERINAVGAELRKEIADLRDEMNRNFAGLRAEFDEFRKETQENFRQVNRKLQILAGEQLDYRAEFQRLEERIERLEPVTKN